jgi:uncharacterized protein
MAFLWSLTVAVCASAALTVPALKGRVNDNAGMLSFSARQQLESMLAQLEGSDSTQIAVLTLPSLEGENLEEFSLKVAESWKIGQKGRDNGALLLIVKNDRKLRIETGYGLEGSLTDLLAGRIIREVIQPRFRDGDFDGGTVAGVMAMIAAVKGEYQAMSQQHGPHDDLFGLGIFLCFAFFGLARFTGKMPRLAAAIGAILAPVVGVMFLGFQWLILLALIFLGLVGGYLFALIFGGMRLSGSSSGSSSGGFSSGGFSSGGGGFSGGGGGFGGGGSSGGW